MATHGRSFWILDDLSPLHQLADAIAAADAQLFAPRRDGAVARVQGPRHEAGPNREVAYNMAGSIGYAYRQVESPPARRRSGPSTRARIRPSGVIVHYWLREAPAGDVMLAFLDADGREIRSFTSREATRPTPRARAGGARRRRRRRGAAAGAGPAAARQGRRAAADEERRAPTASSGTCAGPTRPSSPTTRAGAAPWTCWRGRASRRAPIRCGSPWAAARMMQRFELVKDPRVAGIGRGSPRAVHVGEEGP